ncbi:Hypothetical protein CGLY_16465 (plasmid) [Corynebacterium glyciniphilum AJ 3170]|uniref:N-acetyltransferase domain-containing protein n=1 Tax=Corynebacterium glyciniphilum AJ 3170 TaxID=1404245 RepID=X5EGE9_9CORY|nr:Hypothetical protein CGLY_16465 [Corynebacterium glyciniphilum AJ 3170]
MRSRSWVQAHPHPPPAGGVGAGVETGFLNSCRQQHEGTDLPAGWPPADFLRAEIHNQDTREPAEPTIIGRTSIRYGLTENLLNYGGHIGYAVAPEFRRQGNATEILHQSLILLTDRGIHRVLINCDDDNVGSAAVIEASRGILEDLRFKPGDSLRTRRYWLTN